MFRELTLTFNGQQLRIKPSMDLIRRLELAGCSPFALAARVTRRDQCFGLYCQFVGEVLRYGGANVTDEQLYGELTNAASMIGIIDQVEAMLSVMLPPSPAPIDTVEAAPVGKPKRARRSANGTQQRSSN